jgi:dTDP-4-dehydrorhamnose reductase
MKLAILGAHGQLGGELCRLLGDAALPLSHAEVDIAEPTAVAEVFDQQPLDAVINCAAYNGVDLAESEGETAFRVNALGPCVVAECCEQHGIPLVQISTDYVFGQDAERTTPYLETDIPGPLGAYGRSKLAGEELVRASCTRHFILRTCGLYGRHGQTGKRNFVETMLKLGREKSELRIVADQRCTPTSTRDLAEAIIELLATPAYGTYHATSAGDCSWAEFATEIFRLAKLPTKVIPITTAEYGAKAPRPGYSVLNCDKLAGVVGRPMRPWREALAAYLG